MLPRAHASRSAFLEIFREETNWLMPLLHTVVYDARMLARRADHEISAQTGENVQDKLVRIPTSVRDSCA